MNDTSEYFRDMSTVREHAKIYSFTFLKKLLHSALKSLSVSITCTNETKESALRRSSYIFHLWVCHVLVMVIRRLYDEKTNQKKNNNIKDEVAL